MIVRAFKPVAWVAAIGTAALGCYMLSLQVAAERAELAALERRIVHTRQTIRSLQTELGTRGRLQQLEQWNADVLALSAPVANQFLDSNVSLARFDTQERRFGDEAQVRIAAAEAPAPTPPQAQPKVRLAAADVVRPAPAPDQPQRPIVRRAAIADVPTSTATPPQGGAPTSRAGAAQVRPTAEPPRPATVPTRNDATPPRPAPAAAPARQASAQARPPAGRSAPPRASLLDAGTLRDLRDEARSERSGSSRN